MLPVMSQIVPQSGAFDINTSASSGLSLRVAGGVLLDGYGYRSVPNNTVELTPSAYNFIQMDADGKIFCAAENGFYVGAFTPLYCIRTNETVVIGIQDFRAGGPPGWIQFPPGYDLEADPDFIAGSAGVP